MDRFRTLRFFAGSATALLLSFACLSAEDKPAEPPKLGWGDVGELAYVATSGNSEVNTLGFKNLLSRRWENALLEINAGGIRSRSTVTTHTVSSAGPPVDIAEDSDSSLTAEAYYANGKYSRDITKTFFWYGFAGWERNRFSGIENRTTVAGGVGNIWKDTDRVRFRTDYALSYVDEEDVAEPPDFDGTYVAARLSSTYQQKFGEVTTYGNDFMIEDDLNDTTNWRGDMTNWVAVAMSARFSLKASLRWLYDHEPAQAAASDPLGLLPPGEVAFFELDKLDTIFTTSLVVKF
ncbi:MAG TPA: DUF481 domain-containing protein [Candidatus Polarisedimenticolia bacterium]|nr:DUF481 domain-containing protein [Candidatus Polarisedimenticolia bacterium]